MRADADDVGARLAIREAMTPRTPLAFLSLVLAAAVVVGAPRASDADPTTPVSPLVIGERALLPQASVDQAYDHAFAITGASGAPTVTLFSPVPTVKASTEWSSFSIASSTHLVGTVAHHDCDASKGSGCPQGWTCGAGNRCEGVVSFVALAQDTAGHWDQRMVDLVVTDPANPLRVGSFPELAPAVKGQRYGTQIYAHGGRAPFTWGLTSGALPAGMTLSTEGAIEGTPIETGDFMVTAGVTDASGKNATGSIHVHVDDDAPVQVTPDATSVVQKSIPRVGYNVGDETTYWNDIKLSNEWVDNPGMEPSRPYRHMYWAWTGTANTLEEWSYAQYSELHELDTGYWNGGKYWVLSGPAKGRTGSIASYTRTKDATSPSGWKAIWTLADSNASMIVQNKPSTDDMEKDIFMVEAPPRNDTSSNHFTGTFPTGWNAYGDPSTTFDVDTTNKVAGTQSAKVVSTVDTTAGLGAMVLWDNPFRRLRSDTTYTISADVRRTGGDGKVTLQLAQVYWTASGGFFSQSFDVPDDGKFHHVEATYVGKDQSEAAFQIVIEKRGTLWIDDALMYESTATTAQVHDTGTPTPVSSKPFDPIPWVLDDLRTTRTGCLRFWYFDTFMPLATALHRPTADDPDRVMSLYSNLTLAEQSGANAWIIAAKEWMPEEFAQLAEYLSSTDTSKGMGALRAKQGHPDPWTKTIGHVYIEYSDEAWNWPNWAYPFDLWHADKYAAFSKERFEAVKSSGFYDASKMTLVLDGQVSDDFWVNDPVDKLTYPAHDAMDEAPYLDTYLNRPITELSAKILDEVKQYEDATTHTQAIWAGRGETTKMLVYEGGPGTSSFKPPAGDEVRKNSMMSAAEFADEVSMLFSHGVGEYNTFTYENAAAWQDVSGASSRFHLPSSYVIRMFNECCGGRDEIAVSEGADAPKISALGNKDGSVVADAPVDAVLARAYVGGDGKQAFLLVNRNPIAGYAVQIATGDDGVAYRVTTLAATRADRGTLEGPGLSTDGDNSKRNLDQIYEAVAPKTTTVNSRAKTLTIALPAMGVVTVTDAPVPPPPGPDAGPSPGSDGGVTTPDGGTSPTNPDAAQTERVEGCGCRIVGAHEDVATFAAVWSGALAFVALAIARRRRARS
jgi:hypothetical protein